MPPLARGRARAITGPDAPHRKVLPHRGQTPLEPVFVSLDFNCRLTREHLLAHCEPYVGRRQQSAEYVEPFAVRSFAELSCDRVRDAGVEGRVRAAEEFAK